MAANLKYDLSQWGLPPLTVAWFRKKGITHLFEWQAECLTNKLVLNGGNIVYSAPTSAGKTLIADFLLLKRVLESNKKALVIEPFIALTREKADTLKSMLYSTKARVGAFGGSYYTPGGLAAVSIAVCTIEKANNFINKLIHENKLSDLGIIVVDEIHYLGDEHRGHQLELLLTKVLFFNSKTEANQRIQIVGMSATIPNLESIAVWLHASLHVAHFRPVPLVEKIKIGNNLYEVNSYIKDSQCEPLEVLDPTKFAIDKDYDGLFHICIETIVENHSALVFCESKRECEIMASNLASQIQISGNQLESCNVDHVRVSQKLRANLSGPKIKDILEKLKKCPAGPDKDLVKSIKFGIAYHHAGLTREEREIIEDGFKSGTIKTLMATSTLSSGVNLPARKVIIRNPTMISSNNAVYQKEMLNPITYRQMIGRAGRKNIDTEGESILICRSDNQEIAIQLIKASPSNIRSSMADRMISPEGKPSGLKKAVLEVIANGTATTRVELDKYLRSTFWLSSLEIEDDELFRDATTKTLRYLITKKFIEELRPGVHRATRLGNAVMGSGISPEESLELVQDLLRAREGFCLSNDLHIIYQVTPNDIARAIDLKDWQHYSKVWNELDDICQIVGQRVGIDEMVVARRAQGFIRPLVDDKERVYRRFWVSLIINDLINELPLYDICGKYRVSKATVQQVQRAVAQYAGVISIFCNQLGYANLAALVTPLEPRINFSCQRDLLDLVQLNITRPVARCLFNSGYKNIFAVAKGDKLDVEFALRQLQPFKKEHSFTEQAAPTIWVPELAKTLSTLDYASHIVESARSYVEIEYDLDLTSVIRIREDASQTTTEDANTGPSPIKRSHPDSGTYLPKLTVCYVGQTERDVDKFINNCTENSSLSLNFKLEQRPNELIGRTSGGDSQEREGLSLQLEIDRTKYIVTRVYACFEDETSVHIIEGRRSLEQIRDKLADTLSSSRAGPKTQSQRQKIFTQNIVLTYKVLHSAFGFTQDMLHNHFEWHAFDVAWWMIGNCSHRGIDNCNSSLSLVAQTKWAVQYHHFLHSSKRRGGRRRRLSESNLVPPPGALGRDVDEYKRLKDIVKSGKTAILKPLIDELLQELDKRKQLSAYRDAELPSRLAMAQMMVHGIGLDAKSLQRELDLYKDLSEQLHEVAQKHYAKSSISLIRIEDVARVLYDDLDLKKHLLDHSTNSNISKNPTNSEVLKILARFHPFPKLVQDYRKIRTALDALRSVNTSARHSSELNMIRVFGQCDFWQPTGRVAMIDPSLFLINKNFNVTIPAHGNREAETIRCVPRSCFVPVAGWKLVAADYSQLELRLLAHFSDDEKLIEILNRSLNSDVFIMLASKIYQKPVEAISKENRQSAKQISYGIIYGMGDKSLANAIGVNLEEAERFRQDFFNAFPKIKSFTDQVIEESEKLGYVESLLGRRRTIKDINSEQSAKRARARRVAINTRIQSSSSDLIKLAMSNVNQKLLENFQSSVRFVLEMHDELIYEVNPAILSHFAKTLKSSMENLGSSLELKVKLLVDMKSGPNWSSMDNYSPDT